MIYLKITLLHLVYACTEKAEVQLDFDPSKLETPVTSPLLDIYIQ